MLHSRISGIGQPVNWVVVDILRIENGLIAEHWDVIQDEATRESSKSGLPMFGTNFPPDDRHIRLARSHNTIAVEHVTSSRVINVKIDAVVRRNDFVFALWRSRSRTMPTAASGTGHGVPVKVTDCSEGHSIHTILTAS